MEAESSASTIGSSPKSTGRKVTAVTSSACTSCRSMHLKCDRLPICSRCSAQGIKCTYLKSQRGYRGAGGNLKPLNSTESSACGEATRNQIPGDLDVPCASLSPGDTRNTPSLSVEFPQVSHDGDPTTPSSRTNGKSLSQRCIATFFQYLYNSHPFLPPRDEFLDFLERNSVGHLETAVCIVGARYVPGGLSASFVADFESILAGPSPPKDASMVQAMLLFALALDGCNDQKRAIQILRKAQSLALELGMNEPEFAIFNNRGSPIYEESLRRTWWELHTVSVVTAGFHGRAPFHPTCTMFNLPLPCEENEFAAGCIPPHHTIEEFDNSSFSDEDIEWSSYTYRIAAVMNLERILQSNVLTSPDSSKVNRQDAYLVNWSLHLPESKRSCFDQSGKFDEMIFQAHMITNVSSILLHRNITGLGSFPLQTTRSITEQTQASSSPATVNIHAWVTAQAASNISRLVTLPVPLLGHTHFFICALALSSITHLSLWSNIPVMAPDEDVKKQILMNLGGLRAVAGTWPAARVGCSEVQRLAQKIYLNRKDAMGDTFWRQFLDEGIVTGPMDCVVALDS